MSEIVELGSPRIFTLEQAKELLPLVKRITKQAHARVEKLAFQVSYRSAGLEVASAEKKMLVHVQEWQEKIHRLGAFTKGMWLVDFDCGLGFYCWKFPETDLAFFHDYSQGFNGRVPIQ
jgi:hypothetical protein